VALVSLPDAVLCIGKCRRSRCHRHPSSKRSARCAHLISEKGQTTLLHVSKDASTSATNRSGHPLPLETARKSLSRRVAAQVFHIVPEPGGECCETAGRTANPLGFSSKFRRVRLEPPALPLRCRERRAFIPPAEPVTTACEASQRSYGRFAVSGHQLLDR